MYLSSLQACNNRGEYETIFSLKQVKTRYQYKGFTITDFHGDNEFVQHQYVLAPAHLHTCVPNNHIREIKLSVLKIEEQVICR